MAVPFSIDLTDKVAVVTGGGGVLCGCMAKALGECGAKVAVLDLREEAAQAVADEIKAAGGTAIGIACSVLDRASLEGALDTLKAAFGPCDILINGAGGNHPKGTTSKEHLYKEDLDSPAEGVTTFFDLDPKGIEFVFGLNFLGTLLPTQVFTRDMAEGGSGVVINISSMNAFTPLTKIPAYSAAKAAVSNFTLWLSVHLSKVGIRVNAIAPGFFLTDQNRSLLTNEDGSMTPRGQTIIEHTPMGCYGDPSDLLGALLWLSSDAGSGFVTGTVVAVDGGFNAFSGV
ncbi:MAG: SDR family oxidoreductase [Lentisphaerae bacterium]|jgi:NAD(P)-dependent dehydrogenase (short-subunit alcohol dehydrogenase family)|nr:SDR family oxidoreductase [Lentisphaerota bacterium]MBT4820920.1 SDR family oxidoreductase [Lentisphaerota bacterium]MBT5608689.1 SDR family oxidoreductase [Lentisphaerota bacterium]MBT7057686.1 SDR family oxidoreductase [Lentisphaerota bacterium]MBT7841653.1 SDR family oxidoreductase [Lentisphaerota bacterium]